MIPSRGNWGGNGPGNLLGKWESDWGSAGPTRGRASPCSETGDRIFSGRWKLRRCRSREVAPKPRAAPQRGQPWHAVIAVVSSALGYAFSWLARDDALVYAALAGLIGFLMVEYLSL